MSSSIGSVGNMSMSMSRMNRPDPSQMASKLFSKLDSSNQGYIEKSDLQSALSQISDSSSSSSTGSSTSTSSTSSADDIFAKLDTDGDGKVTKDEFTSSLKKLSDELDSQFNSMRMNGFGGQQGSSTAATGGMPPPPPDGGQSGQSGSDSGFTKDELTSQLNDIGSSDSKRATLLSNVVNNFDTADSNGDGKVTFTEAMALQKSLDSASSTSTASSSSTNAVGDAGFTKDELTSQLNDIGTSDSKRSTLISNVLDNFDTADSNSDGKVSFKEAMALQQSLDSASSSSSTSSDSSSSNSSSASSDAQLMKTIMQLAQAYGAFGQSQQQSNFASLLSTAA